MPSYDPYHVERLDLQQQGLAQKERAESDRLTLAEEAHLLQKKQLLFNLIKAKQQIIDKQNALDNGTQIIRKLGAIDDRDPQAAQKAANILADHAAGYDFAKGYVEKRLAGINNQQKLTAEAFTPGNVGKASYDLNTAIKGLDSMARQYKLKNQPVPAELTNAQTNLTKYLEGVGSTALATLTPPQPSNVVPASTRSALPAPSATPAPNVQDFFKSVGISQPATPAPITSAPAVAAVSPAPTGEPAQSGLPDEAEAEVRDDENEN